MNHWTIRWRIVASFAVILALMIVMATVAYVLLKRIDRITNGIEEDVVAGLSYSQQILVQRSADYSLTEDCVLLTDKALKDAARTSSAVAAGVMGMDKFSEEVRLGMQDVQHISHQLTQVIQQVQALAPKVDLVNDGMQAQASGAEQITQALVQLGEAAQQTVDSLRQSSAAIEELNQVAIGLRTGVSRFTLQEA